jgi:hypothetical protein
VSETTLRRLRRGERVDPETLGRVTAAIAGAAVLTERNDVDANLDDRFETVERQLAELELRVAGFAALFMSLIEVALDSGVLGESA